MPVRKVVVHRGNSLDSWASEEVLSPVEATNTDFMTGVQSTRTHRVQRLRLGQVSTCAHATFEQSASERGILPASLLQTVLLGHHSAIGTTAV